MTWHPGIPESLIQQPNRCRFRVAQSLPLPAYVRDLHASPVVSFEYIINATRSNLVFRGAQLPQNLTLLHAKQSSNMRNMSCGAVALKCIGLQYY